MGFVLKSVDALELRGQSVWWEKYGWDVKYHWHEMFNQSETLFELSLYYVQLVGGSLKIVTCNKGVELIKKCSKIVKNDPKYIKQDRGVWG